MEGAPTVADVMTREFLGVSEGDPVAGVVSLMVDEDADCAVVVRGEEAVGLVAERDVMAAVADGADLAATTAGTVMADPEPTVPVAGPLPEAAAAMAAAGRRVLVATEDGAPAGVVTAHDLATAPAALGPSTLADTGTGAPAGRDAPSAGTTDPVAPADSADAGGRPATGEGRDPEAFTAQSVCERCGALAGDLRNFNGQLVCPDCRET